ncbi:hypothetical protein A2U01_0113885, partial [Trifolium medium]|nr:hypothetical protein [Trifolium medium]
CVGTEGGLVKPKFEAEFPFAELMPPSDVLLHLARCALHISPVLASRPETY